MAPVVQQFSRSPDQLLAHAGEQIGTNQGDHMQKLSNLLSILGTLLALGVQSCSKSEFADGDQREAAKATQGDLADSLPPQSQDEFSEVGVDAAEDMEQEDEPNNDTSTLPVENEFQSTQRRSLSTFSTDVDTASYSYARAIIESGRLPAPSSIRTEEFINYFDYQYPAPAGEQKLGLTTHIFTAPWNPEHKLVRIGIKASVPADTFDKPMNLVFLIDTSGSMQGQDRLGLVQSSLEMLLENLRDEDRVAIVTYAGNAKIALPSTSAGDRQKILSAIGSLDSGGSTNGAAGIIDAYQIARDHYIEGGVNRVILATDGDFNVGVSDDEGLVRLIKEKAATGVYLTILGYGMGNFQDGKMEKLSLNGNGNYAYVDSKEEAKRIFGSRAIATLVAVAKDTKIQIEFNPRVVSKFRLIGYENRKLKDEEFNDDKRDAGDMGAGHAVTALYEIVPRSGEVELDPMELAEGVDPLVFRDGNALLERAQSEELMNIKLRYKDPEGSVSRLVEHSPGLVSESSEQLQRDSKLCAAVAAFALVLRKSKHIGETRLETILSWLDGSVIGEGADSSQRAFLELLRKAKRIQDSKQKQ
jgi:Ca-activated chloride channel family protein